jgi:hypothetical protein
MGGTGATQYASYVVVGKTLRSTQPHERKRRVGDEAYVS